MRADRPFPVKNSMARLRLATSRFRLKPMLMTHPPLSPFS